MQSVASRLPIGLMLLAAALAAPLGAQDRVDAKAVPRYRARVLGVYDEASGDPLDGVRVLDVLNGNSALTTITGTVSLDFLPDGGSLVRLQKIGYATQTFAVKISAADTTPVTVILSRVTALPAVVTRDAATPYISANLRGFMDRMKSGNGYFIDDATLRKNEGRQLAGLLSTKPGVIISRGTASSAYLQRSPRCVGGGAPQIFLDGVPMGPTVNHDPAAYAPSALAAPGARSYDDPNTYAFNLTEFDVSQLAGVEWYPDNSFAPPEFAGTSLRCGVLLLWTRER